ncbi:MAG: zinc-ribbon domain-containing protein, partial [Clostridia bacterium]|nr:zinc-ribbon domain-containing protein [Clostridia bacterium]
KFCPECGAKMPTKRFCTNCGAQCQEGAKFCPECGNKLG